MFIFNYKALILFDGNITQERQIIIQFLANFGIFTIEYNGIASFFFIFFSWTIISLLPIFIYGNYKKAWTMNILTFFFPNFFFYVFYGRYSPNNYNLMFPTLFWQTFLLGLYLVVISIGISLLLKRLKKNKEEVKIDDLKEIENMAKSTCPHCGTKFESIPKYCYNCLKEINTNETD